MAISEANRLVRWLYLDMNSFFASVEQEMNPALRGKPVAVIPLRADTTCCIAVSYEGKAFGVKTGTKVGEAKRLCPRMIFIEGDHRNYVRYHDQIVAAVDSCLPIEAVCSIDEIACRLTGAQRELPAAQDLALRVKSAIKTKVGTTLKCSIGAAPNRFLAKIAADMKKPDGFTAIAPRDLPQALYALRLRDIPGIGPNMEARLNERSIRSVETLCSLDAASLRQAWGGVRGEELWRLLRGEDWSEKPAAQKSISRSHVLPPDLRHKTGALRILKKLMVKAAARLRREGFFASGIQIFIEFRGRDGWRARQNLMETRDTRDFLLALAALWRGVPAGSPCLVGAALTGLVPEAFHQPSLFEDRRRDDLNRALDSLNDRFGKDAVHYGAIHESEDLAPTRVAFARIPREDEG